MTTNDMITELTQTVSTLQRDVEMLKEDKDYLYKGVKPLCVSKECVLSCLKNNTYPLL